MTVIATKNINLASQEYQYSLYSCVLKNNIPPNFTLAVLLPVNDVIERDWLSVGVKIHLLLKLVGEIHHLQMMQ